MRLGYLGVIVGLLAGASLSPAQTLPAPQGELPAPTPGPAAPGTAPPAGATAPAPAGQAAPGIPGFYCPPPPPGELPAEGGEGCGGCTPANAFDACDPSPCSKCRVGYVELEYLLWTIQNPLAPDRPLLTSGTGTSLGIPGMPGTVNVVSEPDLVPEAFAGFHGRAGLFVDCVWFPGIEVGGFFLGKRHTQAGIGSNVAGTPLLARPFFDTTANVPAARVLAQPGVFVGQFLAEDNFDMWGVDASSVICLYEEQLYGRKFTADLLVGYRYLNIDEGLKISDLSAPLGGGLAVFAGNSVPAGAVTAVTDRFDTRNQYHGGALGLRLEYECGRFSFEAIGRFSLGVNHQTINAFGFTSGPAAGGAPVVVTSGGLLATAATAGSRTNNEFAYMPEGELKINYEFYDGISVSLGYSCLFLNRTLRPGTAIPLGVNPALVPTNPAFASPTAQPIAPVDLFRQMEFFAGGLSVGLSFRF